jgi:hypothetical protein
MVMNVLLFLTISFSFNYLFVTSRLLAGFRNWFVVKVPLIGDFLTCLQCVGFWSSVLFYSLSKFFGVKSGVEIGLFSDYLLVDVFIYSSLASLFSVVCNSVIVFLNSWR